MAITTGTRSAKRQVEESGSACEDGRILRNGFHAEDDYRGVGKRGVGNKTDVAGLWESKVDDRGAATIRKVFPFAATGLARLLLA